MTERTAALPTVTRPNSKVYAPRVIKAHAWDNEDHGPGGYGAVVLGTHDVERARVLARDACDGWFGTQYVVAPEVGWFRSGYEYGRPTWIRDDTKGAAGVMFTASDDPEG